MVLSKSFRVWRKYRPRSVLLESKENPEEALLFESDTIAILCKTGTNGSGRVGSCFGRIKACRTRVNSMATV